MKKDGVLMKFNIGNDIIKTERIERLYKKYGHKFIDRVYTNNEIKYCESKGINKFQSYAGRFAAKEAIFKAISSYVDNKFVIGWKDIEILNDAFGKPCAISKSVQCKIDISISHEKEYAVAVAIAISD